MPSAGELYRAQQEEEKRKAQERATREAEDHRRYEEAVARQEQKKLAREREEEARSQKAKQILNSAVKGQMQDLQQSLPRGVKIVEEDRSLSLVWDHKNTKHPRGWAADSTEEWKEVTARVKYDNEGNASLSIGGTQVTDASQIPSALAKNALQPHHIKETHWKKGQEPKGPPDPGGQGRYS